ncbi:MAG: Flp family type IVb pilin [Acidimicrobiales bacterium]
MAYALWCMISRVTRAIHLEERADETGATLVEYALLVALIALVCLVGVRFLGGNTSAKFSQVGSAIQ